MIRQIGLIFRWLLVLAVLAGTFWGGTKFQQTLDADRVVAAELEGYQRAAGEAEAGLSETRAALAAAQAALNEAEAAKAAAQGALDTLDKDGADYLSALEALLATPQVAALLPQDFADALAGSLGLAISGDFAAAAAALPNAPVPAPAPDPAPAPPTPEQTDAPQPTAPAND